MLKMCSMSIVNKFLSLIIAFICINADGAVVNSVAPPAVGDEIAIPATTKMDHVKSVSFGGTVFEFEKSTLSEIQKAAGSGEIDHSGDAAESQYWLCYSFNNQTVWFVSHGEMGGSSHALTEVQAISKNLDCVMPKNDFQKIQSSFGWLGMSSQELREMLGSPASQSTNIFRYYYAGKVRGPYDGKIVDWDVSAFIQATIENNKVASICASHVTSY